MLVLSNMLMQSIMLMRMLMMLMLMLVLTSPNGTPPSAACHEYQRHIP